MRNTGRRGICLAYSKGIMPRTRRRRRRRRPNCWGPAATLGAAVLLSAISVLSHERALAAAFAGAAVCLWMVEDGAVERPYEGLEDDPPPDEPVGEDAPKEPPGLLYRGGTADHAGTNDLTGAVDGALPPADDPASPPRPDEDAEDVGPGRWPAHGPRPRPSAAPGGADSRRARHGTAPVAEFRPGTEPRPPDAQRGRSAVASTPDRCGSYGVLLSQ